MAGVTINPAAALRSLARDAVLTAGGRGFVRYLPEGRALLVTDAARRAPAEPITEALAAAGFVCRLEENGLIIFSPSDARIAAMAQGCDPAVHIGWDGPLHPAQALADRFMRQERAPLTDDGRQLIFETLRLCSLPEARMLEGLGALRARAAAMLRGGDSSGMAEAGRLLSMIV